MLAHLTQQIGTETGEDELLNRVAWERLPRHVAIIMDGNGRWAKDRGLSRTAGHRAGVEAVRAAVDTSARLGLGALTLYAFSTENWKRPRREVAALMHMLKRYLRIELEEIHRQNVRLRTIGRIDGLPHSVRREIQHAVERTSGNNGLILSLALNYGGRAEIIDACRAAISRLQHAGRPAVELTEEHVEQELYTNGLPPLDLVIRTSGEMRISNFLLWQVAYSEIYVTETLWPDFRRPHLIEAVLEYQRRDRRFGGLQLAAQAQ
jgi:undecaprenyl diphosphate synthase